MTEQEFLRAYDIKSYEQPSVTSDIVVLSVGENPNKKEVNIGPLQILLIKRASHPFKDTWALPGGFCRPSESVYETARRELYEETNIRNTYLSHQNVYSRQDRDPRGWIISNAFLSLIDHNQCSLRADTDAWDAKWFTIESLNSEVTSDTMYARTLTHTLTLVDPDTDEKLTAVTTESIVYHPNGHDSVFHTISSGFAFDHAEIITQTLINYRETIKKDIRPVFSLLPKRFTLGELTEAYRVSLGIDEISTGNFRRRINEYVIKTDDVSETKGFRPAALYERNPAMFLY